MCFCMCVFKLVSDKGVVLSQGRRVGVGGWGGFQYLYYLGLCDGITLCEWCSVVWAYWSSWVVRSLTQGHLSNSNEGRPSPFTYPTQIYPPGHKPASSNLWPTTHKHPEFACMPLFSCIFTLRYCHLVTFQPCSESAILTRALGTERVW